MEVWNQEYQSTVKKYERYIFQIFRIVCIAIAIWMSIDLTMRYLENEDKASVTYKKFHDSPRDRYPTYTLCFQSLKRSSFYNETYLKHEFNLTKFEYQSILSGDVWNRGSNDSLKMMYKKKDITKIDFEKAAKHPMDVISDYLVGYNMGQHTEFGRKKMGALKIVENRSWFNPEYDLNMTTWPKLLVDHRSKTRFSKIFPFYKSYQDDQQICLTRRNEFREKVTRSFEHLAYWTWKNDYFDRISVYMHHPGQGMRQFFQKYGTKALTDRIFLFNAKTSKLQNVMKFSVNHVSVLRQRPDGNQQCDPYHVDDEKMFSRIFKIIPCVPVFWKTFLPKNAHQKECKTGFEIQEAMKVVKEAQWGDATPNIDPPCDQMTIHANVEKSKTGPDYADKLLLLKFHFVSEAYQEIINVRDFGFEAFWSSIGGLMGMFLGYSCLQIAELTMERIYTARTSYFVK